MQFTIAIDGPAAAGKGTIARGLAEKFGFAHLDTGMIYRAVAKRVLNGTPAQIAASTLRHADIARDDLRAPEVSAKTSEIATDPEVRQALVEFQREFAMRQGGAVLDGRDIGTVICPDADVKFFVTASPEVRAHRRWLEHRQNGHDLTEAEVLRELKIRDDRDANRSDAPMRAAGDAIVFDTSDLNIADALAEASKIVANKIGGLA